MWFDNSSSATVTLVQCICIILCFSAQNLKYSVKNDIGLVVFDMPGKASGLTLPLLFTLFSLFIAVAFRDGLCTDRVHLTVFMFICFR